MNPKFLITLFCFFAFNLFVVQAMAQTKKTGTAKTEATKNDTRKDKVIGKDEKGRTLYEGQKGGKYYIAPTGEKRYIGKDNKETKEKPQTPANPKPKETPKSKEATKPKAIEKTK